MGVLLIVLGLACAGMLADFVIENHLASAPTESFALAGGTVHLSAPAVVLIAFGLGVVAILLLVGGSRLGRRRRAVRRDLKRRVDALESENALLREEPPDTTGSDAWVAEQVKAARVER
jgi:lipopolysaccharide assembly LapA-like protein